MRDYEIGSSPYDEPVWRALTTALTAPFRGTPSDLLRALHASGVDGLPDSARTLSLAIERVAPWMSGWRFERPFRGSYHLWDIRPPPVAVEPGTAGRDDVPQAPAAVGTAAPDPPAE
jgi:hypothetical protein